MSRVWMTGLLLWTVGCGETRSEFEASFTDQYCRLFVECGDPALLTFEGILTEEDCVREYQQPVVNWGLQCKYKRNRAKDCMGAMEVATCPAEGTEVWEAIPAECQEVFDGCGGFDPLAEVADNQDTDNTDDSSEE